MKIENTELSIEGSFLDMECDGCFKNIKEGDIVITGIESCCGGGCSRTLCLECVENIYIAVNKYRSNYEHYT